MKLLTEENEFSHCQSMIDSLISREKRLPDQVFKKPLSYFAFIHSDDIFHERDFFEAIKSFLTLLGENRCFLAVIDPEPVDYFFNHFGKYPVVEMSVDDSIDSYRHILQEDPGNSPADSIACNSTVVVLYSDSASWAIYADRGYELGIVGFDEVALREMFKSTYPPEWVFNVDKAIETILGPVYRLRGIPADVHSQLTSNYCYDGS